MMKEYKNLYSNYTDITVDTLEWFKDIMGFTNEQLLNYMNSNNLWNVLENKNVILGYTSADERDIVALYGGGMSLTGS